MRKLILILTVLISSSLARAQDTLMLSMHQTDSIFVTNNLMLLAARYKVDGAKALIQQARLWDNPTLSTEWNVYNPQKQKYFDAGANGQKIIAIEQVVSIAGKRNKRIELAKANAQFSGFEFYELMRALKTELHTSYYAIYFNTLTIEKYTRQLSLLGNIIDALQVQNEKGNIPLKEVLRLKAMYYQLNNERTDLASDLLDAQQNLATLLQLSQPFKPAPSAIEFARYNTGSLDLKQLLEKAAVNRPDLKMAENISKQADINYVLQKRTAYPDLHIGGVYDQAGSYVNNYTGVTLGFDLPAWNRNQGNIKYAKAVSDQYKAELKNKNTSVNNEVVATYQKLLQVEQEYKKVDTAFGSSFDQLNEGFIANFQKRNISMMEFTDFFEAYYNSVQQLNKLNETRIQTYEELNYVIGEELFR
jgi:cobalt-zinc-cadmium efflux system outer membrane protein